MLLFIKTMTEIEQAAIDVQETIGKAGLYFEENKKSITIIGGAIVVLIGGYFAWTKLYIAPMEEQAQQDIYIAQNYFEKDSLDKAINGDGTNKGFKKIIEDYGLTETGSLAHMYLGLCYLHKGQFEDAVSELQEYDGDDMMLKPMSIGAQGDALCELGKADDAIGEYLKAADADKNNFTSPYYLMKAATLYESLGKYKEALQIYEQLKTDFFESREGRDAEKYISLAKAKAGIE